MRTWPTNGFDLRWQHEARMSYAKMPTGSKKEAAEYFIDHKRDDVSLFRVELVGPDDPGVREYAHSPITPFDPLRARRKLDADADAR
jgi:hypothetical protein